MALPVGQCSWSRVLDAGLWLPTKLIGHYFSSIFAASIVYAETIDETIREHIREHEL